MIGRRAGLRAVVAVGLAAAAGPALAQTPPPTPQPVSTGPTSYGWPGATPFNNPVLAPPVVNPDPAAPPTPPPLLESDPSVFGGRPPAPVVVTAPNGLAPLPGSVEDNFNAEVAARRRFQYCTYNGTRVSAFPGTLLWTPPLAEKRSPRMQVQLSTLDNYRNDYTLDNSIGGTVGLLRVEPVGADTAYQLDLFAVVHTRLSPEDLIATDYRFGFPLTFRRGDWHGKLAYEHTSTHLGDEIFQDTGRLPINFSRDEAVAAVGRRFPGINLRVYGEVSYAFFQDTLGFGDRERFRFDAGFEWVYPYSTGFAGAPFVAAHFEAQGVVKYNPNVTVQVGYIFQNPLQRLANLRIYGEYYDGHSQFGQFFRDKETFFAVGLAGDF